MDVISFLELLNLEENMIYHIFQFLVIIIAYLVVMVLLLITLVMLRRRLVLSIMKVMVALELVSYQMLNYQVWIHERNRNKVSAFIYEKNMVKVLLIILFFQLMIIMNIHPFF